MGVKVPVIVGVGVLVTVKVLVGEKVGVGVSEGTKVWVKVTVGVGVLEGVEVTVKVVVGVLVSTGVKVPVGVPEPLPAGATGSILPQSQAMGMAARAIKIKMSMDRFMSSAFQGCLRFSQNEVGMNEIIAFPLGECKFRGSNFKKLNAIYISKNHFRAPGKPLPCPPPAFIPPKTPNRGK